MNFVVVVVVVMWPIDELVLGIGLQVLILTVGTTKTNIECRIMKQQQGHLEARFGTIEKAEWPYPCVAAAVAAAEGIK